MLLSEFKATYPKLYRLLNAISKDNGMNLGPLISFPGYDVDAMEAQANKIPADKVVDFAVGDEEEIKKYIGDFEVEELSDFLNDCFDGDLTEYVFYDD